MARTTFHPFDGGKPLSFYGDWPFCVLAESFAHDAMPLGWDGWDERACDREFQTEVERYRLVEMFDADENRIEVVTCDGEPIGVLDASVSKTDLARYMTCEQIEAREAAE